MKKVKQQDIANSLGISRVTVSKALNNKKGVTNKMRSMVLLKAQDMGYSRLTREDILFLNETMDSIQNASNPSAKRVINLFTESNIASNSFWSPVINSLAGTLADAGFDLSLCFLNVINDNDVRIPTNFNKSTSSGIVLMGYFTKKHFAKFKSFGLPIISIDTIPGCNILPSDTITCENKEPIKKIVSKLIDQGHTRIGYIGPTNVCYSFDERYFGYLEAMKSASLPILQSLCMTSFINKILVVNEDLLRYFSCLEALPTAIVCCNDSNACILAQFLNYHSLKIAVTGFDNLPEATTLKLTTVHVPRQDLGTRAAEEIVWRINNPERSIELIRLESTPIFRHSTESLAMSGSIMR